MPRAITRSDAFLVGKPPGGPAPPPVKPGVRWILVVTYLSILRTAASKSKTLSYYVDRFFSPLFDPQSLKSIIGLGPYTVGVKIKDFNSGVGILLLCGATFKFSKFVVSRNDLASSRRCPGGATPLAYRPQAGPRPPLG